MPYVNLDIPAGVSSNGTKYQAKGRWYSANLVRWTEGAMGPIGGWTKMLDSDSAAIDLTKPVRGILGWRSNAQAAYLATGDSHFAYGITGGVVTDITPADFSTGGAGGSSSEGQYGNSTYGTGLYGQGAAGEVSAVVEANSWQFDNFGEELVGTAYSDGRIFVWDLNPANNLAPIDSEAPVLCKGVVVTPERFVVALGGKGQVTGLEDSSADGRRVIWCDQENYSDWDPTTTGGQAGDFILPGPGQLMCGARMRQETLLWTDVDLFSMRYIGGLLVYSFVQVGSNCGIISRRAHAEVDGRSYWMGHRGFYMYDGFSQPLRCDISDTVFSDINLYESSRFAAWSNSEFNEVWFSYASSESEEVNKVVAYNYLEDHWSGPWDLVRTDGIDRSVFRTPVMADSSGGLYYHETGTTMLDEDDATALVPSAESGPYEIGKGDKTLTVRRYIPDEHTAGDVAMTIKGSLYPTDSESEWGEQSVTVGEISDVRFTARQVRLGISQSQTGWRFGKPRLEIVERGRR
jgi:hypothetical protein